MYGIAIGEDGEAYEVGRKGARKKIPSTNSIEAKKSLAEMQKKKAEGQKKASDDARFEQESRRSKAQERRKAHARRRAADGQEAILVEALNEWTREGQMRGLPGIGDGLAGFGDGGEFVQTSGTDFGGLWDDTKTFLSAGTSGVTNLVPPSVLEPLVMSVIKRRAEIESGDKAFFERMRNIPQSAAKTKEISDKVAYIKKRDAGANEQLRLKFAEHVLNSLESSPQASAKALAPKLRQLFDNPWMVLQKKGTIENALAGYDDGLGLIPLVAVAGGSAVTGMATTYMVGSVSDAKIAQQELDKNRNLLKDPSIPAEAKIEIAKSLSSGTAKLSEAALETAKQGGIIGNIGGAVNKMTTLVIALAALFVLVKVGIPMMQARQRKA